MFENTTELDTEALNTLANIQMRTRGKWNYWIRKTSLLALGILCIGSGGLLLLYFRQIDFTEQVLSIVALVLGVLALLEALLQRRVLIRNLKRNLLPDSAQRLYIFGEQEFWLEIPGGEAYTVSYRLITYIYESRNYMLLLRDSRRFFLVHKAGFTKGTADDFREFIAGVTGKEIETVEA